MSGKNKHRNTTDYVNYLKGELSAQERHAFERGLEADPFEQEAMEGLESLSASQAEEDLLTLHHRLRQRLARRRRVAFYSIAATVASLLIVGTIFLKVRDFNPRSQEGQAYPEDLFEAPVLQDAPPPQPEPEAFQETPEESGATEKGLPEAPSQVPSESAPAEKKEPVNLATQDAEPELEISQMAAPRPEPVAEPEALEKPDEQITYVEAEPAIKDGGGKAARTERAPLSRKKSNAQPVAAREQPDPENAFDAVQTEEMLTGKVTGIVISAEDQKPIPGAVVVNRESNSGVYTDLQGRFGIQVQEDTPSTLVTSFIGMETQEYKVENGADVELIMQPDAAAQNEVLMLGYVAEQDHVPTGSAFELYQAEKKQGVDYDVPEPSVGFMNYRKYIEENIRPPKELGSKKEVVVLKFTVTRAGKIEEVLALKSPGEAFTEEATRLLMEGPGWNPAANEQGTKDQSVRIRIVFRK